MKFTLINGDQFKEEVIHSRQPILVEFSSQYCSACQEVKQFIQDNLTEEIKLLELDIAENQQLAADYGVDKTPTLLLFKQEQVAASHVGYIDHQQLDELLAALSFWKQVKQKLKSIFSN